MIFYGRKASKIADFQVTGTECTSCHNFDPQHVVVFGKYAHLYWIPMFPMGKVAVSECTHCLKTIEQKDFPKELKAQINRNRNKIKTPFWHWIGLLIIGFIIVVSSIASATRYVDPREELLNADIASMTNNPIKETDSISYKLKTIFDIFTNDTINPSNFKYLTKVKDDKALILVKIPNLKQVEKDGRKDVFEIIEMVTNKLSDMEGKQLYIGIHGKYTMMMLKTPTAEKNANTISPDPLFEFYGPKPEKE